MIGTCAQVPWQGITRIMSETYPPKSGAIIVLSSHVVRGTVGNRAAAFALEALGHPVWVVPTIILPWHPGHTPLAGPGTRIVPEAQAFDNIIENIARAPWLGEVRGVLSGYLGNAEQAQGVAKLVKAVKAKTPSTIYALDPVMGDGDALYVPENQAETIRHELLPLADIITPNAFELGFLTKSQTPSTAGDILEAAKKTNVSKVLATSSPARDNRIGNLLISQNTAEIAHTKRLRNAPNGAGDLTAALILAGILDGYEEHDALLRTTASVFELLEKTLAAGSDELLLEQNQESLRQPRAAVEIDTVS